MNNIFRLGDHLCVRLPRVQRWAQDLDKEWQWLPTFAPRLPLRAPGRLGRSGTSRVPCRTPRASTSLWVRTPTPRRSAGSNCGNSTLISLLLAYYAPSGATPRWSKAAGTASRNRLSESTLIKTPRAGAPRRGQGARLAPADVVEHKRNRWKYWFRPVQYLLYTHRLGLQTPDEALCHGIIQSAPGPSHGWRDANLHEPF